MKKYLPQCLQFNSRNEKIKFDADGGYEISFQFVEKENDEFYLYKTPNSVSPTFLKYTKRLDELHKKYDSYRKKGYMFGTKNTCEGRTVFGCSKGPDFIILEDITELEQQLLDDDSNNIVVKVESPVSGTAYEVFNNRKNGYDALASKKITCNMDVKFQKLKCKKCGNDTFAIYIKIHNTGHKDLLESQPCEEITEENWTNAFDWITIDKKCYHCGHLTKKWLNLETM